MVAQCCSATQGAPIKETYPWRYVEGWAPQARNTTDERPHYGIPDRAFRLQNNPSVAPNGVLQQLPLLKNAELRNVGQLVVVLRF